MSKLTEQIADLTPQQRDLLVLLLGRKKREEAARSRIAPVSRSSNTFPLSFAQQRLWFLNQLQQDSAVYNVAGGVRMEGPLSVVALERALNEVVLRHEALRTTIGQIDGEPVQVISSPHVFHLPKFDLRNVPQSQRETEAQLLLTIEARKAFNVEGGPLFRATLLLLSAEEHILLLTLHHIISDGWSIGILVRELMELYEAFVGGRASRLAQLPVQYVDFAAWHREWLQGELLEKAVSYWKEKLAGAPSLLELPTDRPRPPSQGFSGARQPVVITPELTESLRQLGEQQNATLFMVLLAAFKVLLFRHARQEDIVVGVPIAGRNNPDLENVIGLFINMIAMRTDLSGNPSFRELLTRVRETAVDAYEHQDLPFEKLVEVVQPERDTSYSPIFQVMFHLGNLGIPSFNLPGLTLTPLDTDTGTSKFDLTLDLAEAAGGLKGSFDYSTELFDHVTIERLAERFQILLQAVVADPDAAISSLPLMSAAEEKRVVVELNEAAEVFPQAACLHQIFEEQVAQTPQATAVTFEGQSFSYADLNRRANQLAHRLLKLGVGPEVPVAICMERSLDLPLALLAVLKAGGAYVPLEPSYPRERLAFIIEEARAPVVLTQRAIAEEHSFAGVHAISLDSDTDVWATESTENPPTEVTDENLCYVIYTSGSTGQPKGAMLHHRGVRNRLLWGITDYKLGSGDVVLHKTPLTFDVSVWEIFAPLLSGARLLIARPGGHQDTAYQLELMAREQVTHVDYVPTMLEVLLEAEGLERCENLKIVTAAGEALTRELRDRFYSQTNAKLYNLYGPTEASLAVTYWVCEPDGEERVIPIGRPMSNVKIYILDKQLQPVPIGVAGELHIGGVAPGRGYLKRPDLTADKFIPDAFGEQGERLYKTGDLARYRSDGAIEFLGRLDHQVKIRGMRMELGEVEAALCQHPAVREAVIQAHEITAGNKSLVAYVVSKQEPLPTSDELRNYLRQRLPEYMVPAVLVVLNELPLTPNGKIDRRALPNPEEFLSDSEAAYIAPESDLEQTIAAVWQQVFNVERVSIHSNFFDLGGNSLLLAKVHSKLRAALNRDIQIVELFKYTTIYALAKYLSESEAKPVLLDSGREQADLRKKLMKRRRSAPERAAAGA